MCGNETNEHAGFDFTNMLVFEEKPICINNKLKQIQILNQYVYEKNKIKLVFGIYVICIVNLYSIWIINYDLTYTEVASNRKNSSMTKKKKNYWKTVHEYLYIFFWAKRVCISRISG